MEWKAADISSKLAYDLSEVDKWIEKHYGGRGRALRQRDDPPLDGEPWMSMAEARVLTRYAVLHFLSEERSRQV